MLTVNTSISIFNKVDLHNVTKKFILCKYNISTGQRIFNEFSSFIDNYENLPPLENDEYLPPLQENNRNVEEVD